MKLHMDLTTEVGPGCLKTKRTSWGQKCATNAATTTPLPSTVYMEGRTALLCSEAGVGMATSVKGNTQGWGRNQGGPQEATALGRHIGSLDQEKG